MKRIIILAVIAVTCWVSESLAAPQPSVEFGGEVFLVKDKPMAGLDLNVFFTRNVGFNFEAAMAFASEEAPSRGVDGTFIGFLLAPHIFVSQPLHPTVDARVGLGVDIWPLTGINADESKAAMPVYGEINVGVTPALRAFFRVRAYLLKSDGLALGEDYEGETQLPFLVSVGLSGRRSK